jgi:hypothetical protein
MISITTIDYDYLGSIFLNQVNDTGRLIYERRIGKVATLDGLSSLSDFGFTSSDNVWTIKVANSKLKERNRLIYLIKSYPILRVANPDGVFIGAIQSLRLNMEPIEFIFTVKQQIA